MENIFSLWGSFSVNGPKPVLLTEACELVGKGVGIGLMGSYCRPAYTQTKHAQGLDITESDAAGWHRRKQRHDRTTVTTGTVEKYHSRINGIAG